MEKEKIRVLYVDDEVNNLVSFKANFRNIYEVFTAESAEEGKKIFTERADGYLTINFKVWGSYDKPKTDLTERLVKGAVGGLLDKFLK